MNEMVSTVYAPLEFNAYPMEAGAVPATVRKDHWRIRSSCGRVLIQALLISAVASASAHGQKTPKWRIEGDTSRAPSGCTSTAAFAALDRFFAALANADSVALAQVMASRRPLGYVYSIGKFTPEDTFVALTTLPDLLNYARKRAAQHERIALRSVRFNGWRGDQLWMGPLYFSRTADDLGRLPREGIGKGGYFCKGRGNQGIAVINFAPLRSPLEKKRP